MTVQRRSSKIIATVILAVGGVVMLYPFLFALLGAFLSTAEFYRVSFLPMPKSLAFVGENFMVLFRRSELWPSILVTLARFAFYFLVTTFTSVLAGYVFAKVQFKGKTIAFYMFMSSMMIPGVAVLIPQYLMFSKVQLINNPLVLFLTGWVSAYNIFLIRQTFISLGDEYKEAAEVDGANFFRVVFSIYMPMVKPVLAVIVINLFIGQWNDYLFPLIYMYGRPEWMPIGYVSTKIASDYIFDAGLKNYPVVMATAIVTMVPPIAVYIAFQKYFVSGLTMGGVKS